MVGDKFVGIPAPTEEEIFKKFEEMGYEIFKNHLKISLFHREKDIEIAIWLEDKTYCKATKNGIEYEWLTLQEHYWLNKLFENWRWFDE